ncbi:phage holin family protein [Priestia aryabhattai]|uniref:phage holin family protein n=1 Tax=Priestia aryabhattai TaxID=412384 RepID=UPI00203ED184|nr:phage holin family protein [Priestia aryabhattai]MCM2978873.1 phage holin family protein [Priestia aryabhattai]
MNYAEKDFIKRFQEVEEESSNSEIETSIIEALDSTRRLYWKIQEAKEKDIAVDQRYGNVLETALKYGKLASLELHMDGEQSNINNKGILSSFRGWVHKIMKPNLKVGYKVRTLFTSLPVVRFDDVKNEWGHFGEVNTLKVIWALVCSVATLIFGGLTLLTWALVVTAVGHTIMRFLANKHKGEDDYVSASRNSQLFLWPFFLLGIGNTLSYVVSINGFPEGSFIAFFTAWLIWAELRGIVTNGETAGFNFPPAIRRIMHRSDNDDLPM